MRKKDYYRYIMSVLCMIIMLGQTQVMALANVAPDGSVNIIPTDTDAKLDIELEGRPDELTLMKAGEGNSLKDLKSSKNYNISAKNGEQFDLNYKNRAGMNLEFIIRNNGEGATLSGDVGMLGDSPTAFKGTASKGKVKIKLTGGKASINIKEINENTNTNINKSKEDESVGEGTPKEAKYDNKEDSNIVIEGKLQGETSETGMVRTTREYSALPESAKLDNISKRMTVRAMPLGMMKSSVPAQTTKLTSGTVTWHKQYSDPFKNYASIFKLDIGGIIYDAVCADAHNYTTAEAGAKVDLTENDRNNQMGKLAYLASIDYWNKSGYDDLNYNFGLVCAARKLNGRAMGDHYSSKHITKRMLDDVAAYNGAIPDNFNTYLAYPTSGAQMMLAWGLRPYGKIKIHKSVGNNDDIVKACKGTYTLAGAVYTVYDVNDKEVGKLTVNSNGDSDEIQVKPGHYKVKETTAPAGFDLDKTVYEIDSKADHLDTVNSKDSPTFAPVKIFLEKKASEDSYMNPSDMSGAEFEVEYYDAIGNISSLKPVRKWKLKTTKNQNGKYTAELRSKNLLPGSDKLFVTDQGDAVLPRGSVTIRETKAPAGYVVDKTVYTKIIDGDGQGSSIYFNSGVPSSHVNKPAIPKISTQAADKDTKTAISMYGHKSVIRDKVMYSGLYEGEKYLIKGILMDRDTNKPIKENGKEITSEKEFIVTKENSFIEDSVAKGDTYLDFKIDTTKLTGKNTVVFETLYYKDKEIAKHRDINDEFQTIKHPQVKTTAKSKYSGNNIGNPDTKETLIDKVTYSNLIKGKTYKVSGTLMDKNSNKPILDKNDKEIITEKEFVAENESGSIELEFTYDSSLRQGKVTVVFETLLYENIPVAVHTNINDKEQSIEYPKIGTKMTGEAGAKTVAKIRNLKLTDAVGYENLVPGKKYKMTGVLMDKETGKEYLQNCKNVTGETEFVSEGNSKVNVEFALDSTKIAGKELVAFERVYNEEGKLIASHEDMNSSDQTVRVAPASIPKTGDKNIMIVYAMVFILCTIELAALTVLRRYDRL